MNIALITARGGSKGLIRKNVLELAGKPLIAWTVEAALESSVVDDCYVTTEDEEIASIAKRYGAKIIQRPMSLAQDNSASEEVLAHAIDGLKRLNVNFNSLVLLQPTSPLRNSGHINAAYSIYIQEKADCVISVFEPRHSPVKAYKLNGDGMLTGLVSSAAPYTPRQQLPEAYQPNGAIYIINVEAFCGSNLIPRDNVYPFVMTESDSIDIDTIDDFKQIELVIRAKNEA